jgi:hypothetical protein
MCARGGPEKLRPMSNPVRISLRILGVVLFFGSLAGVAFIAAVGPDEIAQKMGEECAHQTNRPGEQCTWGDVLNIMQALPWLTLVGAVFMLVMRTDWVGKDRADAPAPLASIDLSGSAGTPTMDLRRPSLRWLPALGVLAVLGIVVGNFVGVTAYRAGYHVKELNEVREKLKRAPRPDVTRPASAPAPAATPEGLARGSLLRAPAFRAAMAQIRRTAPAGARLSRLRVAADRIDAEVLAGGRTIALVKTWNGRAKVESTAPTMDGDEVLVAFDRLDTSAPQRVAAAAARRKGTRTSSVDYLVLFDAVGLRWNGFMADGAQITATPGGRVLS